MIMNEVMEMSKDREARRELEKWSRHSHQTEKETATMTFILLRAGR